MKSSPFLKGLAVAVLSGFPVLHAQTPNVSATQRDTFTPNGAGRVVPGGNISYTIEISNTAAGAATGMSLANPTPSNTTLVPGSLRTSCIALPDAYNCLGNVSITIAAPGVMANDVDPDNVGPAVTVTAISNGATAQGGTVNLSTDGGFTYNPPAGFTGQDTFTYTFNDNEGNTDTATVTITVSGMIWFVNANAGTNGDGRLSHPFNNLPSFQAINDNGSGNRGKVNQTIFLYESATSYAGGIILLEGQKLIGQDSTSTLAAVAGLTPPAGSATLPVLDSANGTVVRIVNATSGGNGVTLGNNSSIRGFTIGNSANFALFGSGTGTNGISEVSVSTNGGGVSLANLSVAGGNAILPGVTSTGGTSGVVLNNVSGSVIMASGSLSGHSSDAISLTGTGNVSYGGSVTKNTGTGAAVKIDSKTGTSVVSLSGAISTSGNVAGVAMAANSSGTTVSFSGGLSLASGGGTAFSATGGGTVNVTGSTNTLSTTTATALNVSNTTIGSSGLTFRSISSNGGSANGIILNNTGTSGGLRVTGLDGGDVGSDPDPASGGTIANKTGSDGDLLNGSGIYLNNTMNVRLAGMQLNGFQNSAIRGFAVNGFSLEHSVISGAIGSSTGPIEGALAFGKVDSPYQNGLTGNCLIGNVNISGSIEHNVEIYNQSGTLNLTIRDSNIHDCGVDGIQTEFRGTAQGYFTIQNNDFSNNGSQGIQISALENSILHATIRGNELIRGTQGNEGILCQNGGNAAMRLMIGGSGINEGNTVSGFGGSAIFVGQVAGQGTASSALHATIQGNTVLSPPAATNHAILALLSSLPGDVSQARLLISGNTVQYASPNARAILVDTPDPGTTPNFHATVVNNTVNSSHASAVTMVSVAARNGSTARSDVRNNLVTMASGATALNVREASGGNNALARGISGSNSAATALAANNPGTTTAILEPTAGDVPVIENSQMELPQNPTVPTLPLLFLPEETVSLQREAPASPAEAIALTEEFRGNLPAGLPGRVAGHVPLTRETLEPVVKRARSLWAATGLNERQLSILDNLSFEVADLPGWHLGEYGGTRVRMDVDAGGNGWFIDDTSGEDAGFAPFSTAAADRVDLLTAVMHEMGHALGLPDIYDPARRDSVMYGFLVRGERRLPLAGEAAGAEPHGHDEPHYLSAPVTIGTLPAGKSIRITFEVTVNSGTSATQISSQGTVTADDPDGAGPFPAISVLTDDPDVAGVPNPTVTFVEQPPSVTNVGISTFEDTQLNFTAGNFTAAYIDPNGDALNRVRILSLPANGTLRRGTTAVAVNDEITAANLGTLNFVPDGDFSGSTGFSWTASDGNAFAAASALVNITVTAVNDAPTLAAITNPSAIDEDAGEQTVALSGISTGPSAESDQTLTVTAVSGNTSLIPHPTVSYTSPAAAGSLSYTPVANASGTAVITVTVKDNGGTANGGNDTLTRQFTVTVNPVADTPSVTNATTLPDTQTTSGLVISRNAADGAEVTHYRITDVQNGTVFLNDGLTPVADGSFITAAQGASGLRFTPAGGFQGNATFDVQASTAATTAGLGGGVVTATIAVNEVVSIATVNAGDDAASEGGGDNGVFTFTRGGSTGPLTAEFQLHASSTATADDFTLSGGSVTFDSSTGGGTVTFPAGQTSVQVTLQAVTETLDAAELAETVRLDVVPVSGAYLAGTPSHATVTIAANGFVVVNVNDSGEGSLRQAVLNANAIAGADTITFGGPVFADALPDVITLTSGELSVTSVVTMAGSSPGLLFLNGNAGSRLLWVPAGGNLSVSGMTLENGMADFGGACGIVGGSAAFRKCVFRDNNATDTGGAIAIASISGSLLVKDCTFTGNAITQQTSVNGGGAIFANSVFSVRIVNSTFSGNTSRTQGGAIVCDVGVDMVIENSTVTGNHADYSSAGGGIFGRAFLPMSPSTLIVRNSIIAGNTAGSTPVPDDFRSPNVTLSVSHTLIGDAGSSAGVADGTDGNIVGNAGTGTLPLATILDPVLADNGGPTPTHALVGGSPALNAGSAALLPADADDDDGDNDTAGPLPYDQRGPGYERSVGNPDLGSFELQKSLVIAAADAVKSEGTGAGTTSFTFTVSRTGSTEGTVTADYAVTGSGSAPAAAADFGGTLPSGQVTIADGESEATVTVEVTQDSLVEADEGFTVTLSDADNDYVIQTAAATGTINDDDTATLSAAKVADGAESPAASGSFRITQSAASSTATVVSYTLGGTATEGTDYTALSGSATIPAGETSVDVTIAVITDYRVEGTETVTLTLASVTSGDPQVSIGTPASASLDIADNVPAAIAASAGTPQGTVVNTTFSTGLAALVTDSGGNPLENAQVTFTAPLTGATGSFVSSAVVLTNASGIATAPDFTANTTAGSYAVTAAVPGVSLPASFTLTNNPAAAASFTVVIPSTATAGVPVDAGVTAHDTYGNIASGYSGSVVITSSDGAAILPANGPLVSGTGTFPVTFVTGGNQTVTATDSVVPAVTGTSGSTDVTPVADLSVAVTDAPDPVDAGSNVTYTITVTNSGPSAAANVSLSDALPAEVTFVSLSPPGGWNVTTPAIGANGTVSASIASMPVGSAIFTLTARVNYVANGTVISNTATVSSTTTDPDLLDLFSTATTTVRAIPEISVYNGPNDASPTITDGQSTVIDFGDTTAGNTITRTFTVKNTGTGTLSVSSITVPAGFSLAAPFSAQNIAPTASVTFSVRYDAAAVGTAAGSVTIASNDDDEASFDFPIEATRLNLPPVASGSSVSTDEDEPLAVILQASDADDDPLAYTIVTGPSHGALSSGTGASRTYTPDANYNGPDSFTFRANDGTADSSVVTVNITIHPVNDAPVVVAAIPDLVQVTPGNTTDITLPPFFSDVETASTSLTYTVSAPTNPILSASILPGNILRIVSSASGTADLTVTATDPENASVADTFQVRVKYIPEIAGSGVPDTVLSPAAPDQEVDLAGYFMDQDNDTLTYAVVSNSDPSKASHVLNGSQLTLHPLSPGETTFTVRATDVDGNSVEDSFLVTVEDPIPVLTPVAGFTPKVNPQTGYYEISIAATNNNIFDIPGFRLRVTSPLTDGITLRNSTAPAGSGENYIDIFTRLAPGQSITIVFEFHSPRRNFDGFDPVIVAEPLPAGIIEPVGTGAGIDVTLVRVLPGNAGVLIEFTSEPGLFYRIEYSSDDLSSWKQCPVPLQAGANRVQWIDRGPPYTDSAPGPSRFYRVSRID